MGMLGKISPYMKAPLEGEGDGLAVLKDAPCSTFSLSIAGALRQEVGKSLNRCLRSREIYRAHLETLEAPEELSLGLAKDALSIYCADEDFQCMFGVALVFKGMLYSVVCKEGDCQYVPLRELDVEGTYIIPYINIIDVCGLDSTGVLLLRSIIAAGRYLERLLRGLENLSKSVEVSNTVPDWLNPSTIVPYVIKLEG